MFTFWRSGSVVYASNAVAVFRPRAAVAVLGAAGFGAVWGALAGQAVWELELAAAAAVVPHATAHQGDGWWETH